MFVILGVQAEYQDLTNGYGNQNEGLVAVTLYNHSESEFRFDSV